MALIRIADTFVAWFIGGIDRFLTWLETGVRPTISEDLKPSLSAEEDE